MRFENALKLMRKHIKIKRAFWAENQHIWVKPGGKAIITEEPKRYDIDAIEVLGNDWKRFKERIEKKPRGRR